MKKEKLKISRLAAAMASSVLILCAIYSGVRYFNPLDTSQYIYEEGNFVQPGGKGSASPTLVSGIDGELPTSPSVAEPGCTSKTVTKDDIFKGKLVPYKNDMTVIADKSEDSVNLAMYKNDCYSTLGDYFPLNKDAADGFNNMMKAYNEATNLTDFAIYGTDATLTGAGSPCPIPFADSKTGNTVDVAIVGSSSIIAYDGDDAEKWVVDNCSDYGYIVRYPQGKTEITGEEYYPWHLRYVGKPHAMIMKANNWCLEEYVSYVKGYTRENPIVCNTNDRTYEIYSVPSNSDVTYLSVPLSGNYEISGDGSTGYIITIEKK